MTVTFKSLEDSQLQPMRGTVHTKNLVRVSGQVVSYTCLHRRRIIGAGVANTIEGDVVLPQDIDYDLCRSLCGVATREVAHCQVDHVLVQLLVGIVCVDAQVATFGTAEDDNKEGAWTVK